MLVQPQALSASSVVVVFCKPVRPVVPFVSGVTDMDMDQSVVNVSFLDFWPCLLY